MNGLAFDSGLGSVGEEDLAADEEAAEGWQEKTGLTLPTSESKNVALAALGPNHDLL